MISYAPLFETMKRKGITSYRLEKAGFSRATYYSIRHGNSISTNTINQLCKILDCTTSEIIEYIPDDCSWSAPSNFCPMDFWGCTFNFYIIPLLSSSLGRVHIREKYEEIKECFPKQRKPAKISNLEVLNAVLYVVENGCKWRSLPKEYGDWHVIYVRVNRWAKKGVLQEAFSPVSTDTGVLRASAKTGKSPCAIWQDDVKWIRRDK